MRTPLHDSGEIPSPDPPQAPPLTDLESLLVALGAVRGTQADPELDALIAAVYAATVHERGKSVQADSDRPPGARRRRRPPPLDRPPTPDETTEDRLCGLYLTAMLVDHLEHSEALRRLACDLAALWAKEYADRRQPRRATRAIPGSERKIVVMSRRHATGEGLHHPGDLRPEMVDGIGVLVTTDANGSVVKLGIVPHGQKRREWWDED